MSHYIDQFLLHQIIIAILCSTIVGAQDSSHTVNTAEYQNFEPSSLSTDKHHFPRPTQFTQSSASAIVNQLDILARSTRRPLQYLDEENQTFQGVRNTNELQSLSHHGVSKIMPANNDIHQQHNAREPTTRSSNSVQLLRNSVHDQQQYATESSAFLSASNLGLALRQATGDESLFHSSPGAFNAPGHSSLGLDEWISSNKPDRQSTNARPIEPVFNLVPGTTTASSAAATTTTSITSSSETPMNEHSNIVLNHEDDVLNKQLQQRPMTREYLTNSGLQMNISTSGANNLDFNNQVIYEGPGTVSSPVGDSYFFSATEKDRASNNYNSNQRTSSNAWWAIGIGQEFELADNLTRDNYLDYCEKSPLLANNKQRSLCRLHPRIMSIVGRGLRLAIDECQSRFASSRWNCSLVLDESFQNEKIESSNNRFGSQIFGEVMQGPNRERSYLNAIIAAGLAQAMTKACSAGELPEECSCDKKIRSKSNKGRVEWVACSDDIDYGARFSRDFTDNLDSSEPDPAATIYLHNNEVGRRVFKSATDITCTCQNGENGLCQTKRCWKHLGSFTDIGDELMRRYESATHVQRSVKDPHKLRPVRRGVRRPKRKDLVFISESPDYCQADSRLGVLGTQNRRCNSTSSGPDSCSLLCCGRGYQVVIEEVEEDCNCKFVWCCQVRCDRCKRQISSDICN